MDKKISIPDNWAFDIVPKWTYDEDGELEVSYFNCGHCAHWNNCKCINHEYVHFSRAFYSCDVMTSSHMICGQFIPCHKVYPAGCVEWDFLGGFNEWHRLWKKQWRSNKEPDIISLIPAKNADGHSHTDDLFFVPYRDFVSCNIMRNDGIYCEFYTHIERSKKDLTGYKRVYEGPGMWIPWDGNRYVRIES